jgi:hypothetical protein
MVLLSKLFRQCQNFSQRREKRKHNRSLLDFEGRGRDFLVFPLAHRAIIPPSGATGNAKAFPLAYIVLNGRPLPPAPPLRSSLLFRVNATQGGEKALYLRQQCAHLDKQLVAWHSARFESIGPQRPGEVL